MQPLNSLEFVVAVPCVADTCQTMVASVVLVVAGDDDVGAVVVG